MQKRAIIMLLVALIMGGIAVSLVNTAIDQKDPMGAGVEELNVAPVVVASVNLEIGTRVSDVMLKVVDWPKSTVPEGAYATIDTLVGEKAPVIIKEIHKGEAVLPYKLSGQGARAGLTPRIPSEMRALTISVNEVRGVAGFVLPGDRVDVLYTTSVGDKRNDFITKSLVQNMLVLGVDQSASDKADKPQVVNAVTLLVTAKQGKMLTLAQRAGELTLLLRNEGDVTLSTDESISMSDIDKTTKKVTTTKTKTNSNYTSVKVIRGLKATTYSTKVAAPAKTPMRIDPASSEQERGEK